MAGTSAGRSGSRWRRLVAEVRSRHDPCWLCGMPIDYTATYPHPDSFTVDHVKSWIANPELREDPANLRPSHARCNATKGRWDAKPGLGVRSEEW